MAILQVHARFKNSGVPATGLSPTVTIYNRSNNNIPVTGAAMTELADGLYYYDFTGFQPVKDYVFTFDGTATLTGSERYLETAWDSIESIVNNVSRGGGAVVANISEKDMKRIVDAVNSGTTVVKSDGKVDLAPEAKEAIRLISMEVMTGALPKISNEGMNKAFKEAANCMVKEIATMMPKEKLGDIDSIVAKHVKKGMKDVTDHNKDSMIKLAQLLKRIIK